MQRLCISVTALICLLAIPGTSAVDWTYDDPDRWQSLYPECGGSSQSPIPIRKADTRIGQAGYMKLWTPRKPTEALRLYNNGYNVVLDVLSRGIQMSGSGFWSHMTLKEIVFHSPSEHTIDGVRYAVEQQLVFQPSDNDALAADGVVRNDLVILSTLYESASDADVTTSSSIISTLLPSLDTVAGGTETFITWTPQLDVQERFYTYRGSLTNPGCTEVVNWHIGTTPVKIRQSDATVFAAALRKAAKATSANGNARPVQKTNGREVKVRTFYSSE
jgi:carbonic anhydrase